MSLRYINNNGNELIIASNGKNGKDSNDKIPVGAGMDYFGSTAPEGYLFADGSAISRTEYADLFAVIGTTYGAGDGSTTFNLPDKREAVTIMKSSTYNVLGQSIGANTKTITKENLPNYNLTVTDPGHTHSQTIRNYTSENWDNEAKKTTTRITGNTSTKTGSAKTGITVSSGGSGTAFNVMQKTLVCNYIIKAVDTIVSGDVTDYINEALEGEY